MVGIIIAKDKGRYACAYHGNSFAIQKVRNFCKEHKLWFVEDNCDALGALYQIDGEEKITGSVGGIGISSFYPSRHITKEQGGAVYTSDPLQ